MARERATDTGALVVAASKVFVEKGYRSATIDDIAEAASISRPTVYKYTKSKQHLLDLMVDEITTALGKDLHVALAAQGTAQDRLRQYLDVHVNAFRSNRAFYAIVFSEEVELSDVGRERFRQWAHGVTNDFRALVEDLLAAAPHGPALDPTVAANLCLSMLTGLHRWYDPDGPTSEAELGEQVFRLLSCALGV